jgi:hypothetical protein
MFCACVLTVMSLMPSARNFLVGHPLAHPLDDFEFALRQSGQRLLVRIGYGWDAQQVKRIGDHFARRPQLATPYGANGAKQFRRTRLARKAAGAPALKHVCNAGFGPARMHEQGSGRYLERGKPAHRPERELTQTETIDDQHIGTFAANGDERPVLVHSLGKEPGLVPAMEQATDALEVRAIRGYEHDRDV